MPWWETTKWSYDNTEKIQVLECLRMEKINRDQKRTKLLQDAQPQLSCLEGRKREREGGFWEKEEEKEQMGDKERGGTQRERRGETGRGEGGHREGDRGKVISKQR